MLHRIMKTVYQGPSHILVQHTISTKVETTDLVEPSLEDVATAAPALDLPWTICPTPVWTARERSKSS